MIVISNYIKDIVQVLVKSWNDRKFYPDIPIGNPVKIGNGPAAVVPLRLKDGGPFSQECHCFKSVGKIQYRAGRLLKGRESQKTCLSMVRYFPEDRGKAL